MTSTPSAPSTSALPERLVAARLPCLATGSPAPAMTKAAAVETLKHLAALEPVPAVSIKSPCRGLMRTARRRIAEARPASSSTVSPFTASATSAAPICASVAAPSSSASRSDAASSRRRFSPRIRRSVNSRRGGPAALACTRGRRQKPRRERPLSARFVRHRSYSLRKFASRLLPSVVRIDSGWNWTPSTLSRRWRRPMMMPSGVVAETSRQSGRLWRSTTSEW